MPASVKAVTDLTTPTGLELDRMSHLTVEWADGVTAKWDIEDLRMACPCAECRSKREIGQRTVGEAQLIAAADASFVGSYALGIEWVDGRCSSIYSFETLRRWADNAAVGTPSFQAKAEDLTAAGNQELLERDTPSASSTPPPDSGSFS